MSKKSTVCCFIFVPNLRIYPGGICKVDNQRWRHSSVLNEEQENEDCSALVTGDHIVAVVSRCCNVGIAASQTIIDQTEKDILERM